MELDYDKCPRCGAELRGVRCEACARAQSVAPRPVLSAPPPAPPPVPPRGRDIRLVWGVRAAMILLAAWMLGTCYTRCGERPAFLGLRTETDGPAPTRARAAIFFLHGYGGSISDVRWLRKSLRNAGVGDDVRIVLVDGPYSTGLGRSWGDSAAQTTKSVERVRALLADELPEGSPPPARVFIAGFSQGAGIAAEVAAVEPRVGVLAAFSACQFRSREALAQRQDLRSLIAHGSRDSLCSVGQSRSLVEELRRAGSEVEYVEFDDNHIVPPQVIAALAKWVGAETAAEPR